MLFGKDLYKQIPLGDFPAPALPSLSPQVFQAAFIHSSKNAGLSRSRFAYHEDFVDNERLEFLGDALLYAIVADYLYRTYPKLRVGYLSAIRQRLVQNTTLAKFARLYKMDQALELGPDSERLRNDAKTNADTFEAFVGAVAQVHGQAAVTRWVEDLIKPYATQLYEYHASTYGELEEPEQEAGSESSQISLAKKRHRYRLCGFFPLPFLFRDAPETKSIAPVASGSHSYGTLIPVSEAATASSSSKGGYARLPESAGAAASSKASKPAAQTAPTGKAAMSGGPATGSVAASTKQGSSATPRKPKSSNANNYTSGEESAKENSAAIKRTKSRDRVALIPPSVTNSQVVKNQLATKQPQNKGATSDGEQPKKSAMKDAQAPAPQSQQTAQPPRTQPGVTFGTIEPGKPAGTTAGKSAGAPTANNVTSAAAGWNTPAEPVQKTLDGWQAAWEAVPKGKLTTAASENVQPPSASAQKTNGGPDTPAKTILKRDAGVTAASLSSAAPDSTAAKLTNGETTRVTLNSAMATYLAALQSARSDPVSYLERHPMFVGKKAKMLEYDDVDSTPAKAIVRVKIDGRVVAQSAAAGTDQKLAKARAAFKAIEALLLLPDMPSELSDAKPAAETPGQTPFKANTINNIPDMTRASSHGASAASAGGVPIALDTPVKNGGLNGAPKPVVNPSTPAQLKKQAMLVNSHPGPFPASFYASLPTVGKENNTKIRYYITSVKGFSSGTYHAILNADLQIIGQCHNMKKASALEEAERQAAADKPLMGPAAALPAKWAFEDQAGPGGAIKPVRLDIKAEKRDATGAVPTLTHALAVNSESDKARLTWLEWFSEDKKAWKCAVLVDAIFQGSAKHAERKSAVSLASTKALEELEAAHKQ